MLVMNRKPLSRRTMLRGAGACLALPLLEAMLPRSVSAQQRLRGRAPSRGWSFAMCPTASIKTNGRRRMPGRIGRCRRRWKCSRISGRTSRSSPGCAIPKSRGGHSGADTWLTAADLEGTPGKDYQNSISVDQIAAEVHGKQTRFPSLELSFHGGTGTAGQSHTLAFDRAGTPLPTGDAIRSGSSIACLRPKDAGGPRGDAAAAMPSRRASSTTSSATPSR